MMPPYEDSIIIHCDSLRLTTTVIEGSLEVKLLTLWTDGKAEMARVREEKGRRQKIREERVR